MTQGHAGSGAWRAALAGVEGADEGEEAAGGVEVYVDLAFQALFQKL